ncbi:uncharacterized protein BP5553_08115 [Venustampulla echinocandica]|uniref:Uncharacterized protein n=1 Tax=Venustampulla echinocandica TaxID=2656787 RepID=A0A370TFS3_9HELO|nr:uncharacterized protein BP5553_08115 [Venustampulla echinocandica]RDL33747.1 hypothetical protein BP5553_08115 [Venustampulla echinocandica]
MPSKGYHKLYQTSRSSDIAEQGTRQVKFQDDPSNEPEKQIPNGGHDEEALLESEETVYQPTDLLQRFKPPQWIQQKSLLVFASIIIGVAIICIATASVIDWNSSTSNRDHSHHPNQDTSSIFGSTSGFASSPSGLALDCGTSNDEALERGCVFDLMVYGWTPPACSEPDLASDAVSQSSRLAQYAAAGEFPWYGEENYTNPLPQDPNILSEQAVIWATNGWHQAHCLYFWQLLARAVENSVKNGIKNTYVLSETLVWSHTYHCNRVLAAKVVSTIDEPVIKTLRIYGQCVRIDTIPDPYLEHGDFVPVLDAAD